MSRDRSVFLPVKNLSNKAKDDACASSCSNTSPRIYPAMETSLKKMECCRGLLQKSNNESQNAIKMRIKLTVELVSLAYEALRAATNEPAAATLLTEKGLQLGTKLNKRSDYALLSVDTAFAGIKISPSARTVYSSALRAGLIQGLTGDDFWRAIGKGPSGRGGLKSLARTLSSSATAITSERGSSSGASPHVMLEREIVALINNLNLRDGEEFILVVTKSNDGTLRGTELLGRRGTTPRVSSNAR